MDCPLCKSAMIVIELDRIETDYCTDCGGIWLDAGELELLFTDMREARGLIASFRQALNIREKIRCCPICLKRMQKIFAGSDEQSVIIDRCRKGHGLWFDRGELPQVLAGGSFDREEKIVKLLSEMFGQSGEKEKNGN